MQQIIDIFLPIVASPALLALLRFLDLFKPLPLARWHFPIAPAVFVAVGFGAMLAYIHTRSVYTRMRRLAVAAIVFFASIASYATLLDASPTEGYVTLYHAAAFCAFFASHVSFGFCVADLCKFFTARQPDRRDEVPGSQAP